jgi:peptidoglycan hydrolase-like protein with peptidoglycan-binding domain
MKALLTKPRNDSASRKNLTPPAPVSRHPITPISGNVLSLQRKPNCACGGGCPLCQAARSSTLRIGAPHDRYEQEADRVAEAVVLSSSSTSTVLPRTGARDGGSEEPDRSALESIAADLGPGEPLDEPCRAFFEPRFGHDFTDVRVHTDGRAAGSARAVNALAYTSGRDVVFGAGQYEPHNAHGRRLLAHELTHVVQQRADPSAQVSFLQRKANAIRFQDEATLDEISDGKKVLKEKDTGEAVIRITTALAELGYYTNSIIDEKYDPPLTTAVSQYQAAKALKGKAPDGSVDKLTFVELDKDFSASYRVEKDVLGKQRSADLLKGTQSLDDAERVASGKAISTQVPLNPVTGLPPAFVPFIVGKGKYEDRLRTAVDNEIVSQYNSMGKGREALHADAKNLYDWAQVEGIANESKASVDKEFGEYKKGPALHKGVNIFDAWKDKVNQLTAGGKAKEDSSAEWRVEKILTGDDAIKQLDQEHGAIQTRAAEGVIVDKIKADLVKKYRKELIETHKGWPGYAANGKIFIQLFKERTDAANKDNMWDFYQTFIHEYIHTLEHPDHVAYRAAMDQQKGGFTLREGVTDYFTKVVWNGITIDDALRKKIEGPLNDPMNKVSVKPLNTYNESENAEKLAGVVGVRNVAAAFFLGKVELIGKK